ncbi:MAG: hypothetical protein R6V40_03465 [Candidatus Moraniibacteriota bacterium]
MAGLKDLHRRLYSKDSDDVKHRERSHDDYGWAEQLNEDQKNPPRGGGEGGGEGAKNKEQEKSGVEREMELKAKNEETSKESKKKWKYAFMFLGLVVVFIGGFYAYIKYKQASFEQERVVISFEGDKVVKSGEQASVVLSIDNNNRTSLEKAELKIDYPEELNPEEKDFMEKSGTNSFKIYPEEIEAYETKEYKLDFSTFVPKGNQVYLDSALTYQPSNFSSFFEREEHYAIDVRDSVLSFSLISEDDLAEGEMAILRFVLENRGGEDLDDLVLELDTPDSFEIIEGDFEDNEENRFQIGDIKSGAEKVFEVKSLVSGEVGTIKNFKGSIGVDGEDDLLVLTDDETAIKLIPPRIELEQVVSDNPDRIVESGESVDYRINFKNNSDKSLSDLILKQNIDGEIVDKSSIDAGRGYYNDKEKQIIWKASDVPALKNLNPGETGYVDVVIPVRDDYEIWSEEDKNITFSTQSQINSLNVGSDLLENKTIYSEELEFKVSTQFDVDVNVVHESDIFDNEGEFPVNNQEETEFTVNLNINNSYNNVRDARIYLTLPSGVVWKDNYESTGGEVKFNSRTNELEWNLDSVGFATGHLNPEERLSFQVGFTLSVAERESESDQVELINNINYEGVDSFTEKRINDKVDPYSFRSLEK